VTLTVSNSSLKQSCSVSTSVTSALEVNFNNMRYINLHFTYFYLLPADSVRLNMSAKIRLGMNSYRILVLSNIS